MLNNGSGCRRVVSRKQTASDSQLIGSPRNWLKTCSGSGSAFGRLKSKNNCNGYNWGFVQRLTSGWYRKPHLNSSWPRNTRKNNECNWRSHWRKRKNKNKEKNEHSQRSAFFRWTKPGLKSFDNRNKSSRPYCALY